MSSKLQQFQPVAEPRTRLGQFLLDAGDVDHDTLSAALDTQIQLHSRSKLGDILLADGMVDADSIVKALSRQSGIGRIDLNLAPPDAELASFIDPLLSLEIGYVPWRRIGNVLVMAIADPADAARIRAMPQYRVSELAFALAEESQIRLAILRLHSDGLTRRAGELCPPEFSCRSLQSRWKVPKFALFATGLGLVSWQFPVASVTVLLGFFTLTNFGTALLRVLAFCAMVFPHRRSAKPDLSLGRSADLPRISVLVPLFNETRILAGLLTALEALDYPRSLLDIKLILEEEDSATAVQLMQVNLPSWIEIVLVPNGRIRTKPRAMNFALPLCKGEIIGIYDAEDRPERDQLQKVAQAFVGAPAKLACVQGALDFYNSKRNWITRCFAVEYAQWFRVLLPGLHRLGAPIPLGGTSVFFRRTILEHLGGWDAHNVTEDADLGMRLARRGYVCGILDSTTFEEATSSGRAWVRQRSRWLKGYAITWASHMRHPLRLIDDMGLLAFITFQLLFLGTLAGYLAFPLHALLWANFAGLDLSFLNFIPPSAWYWLKTSHLVGLGALVLVALRALLPKTHRHLIFIALTMPLYWPLGAIASWRALAESFVAPYYWAKTEHGKHLANPTK